MPWPRQLGKGRWLRFFGMGVIIPTSPFAFFYNEGLKGCVVKNAKKSA
jgi:hypothetical protein